MDKDFFKSCAYKIFNTPSPSGYTVEIVSIIGDILNDLLNSVIDNKILKLYVLLRILLFLSQSCYVLNSLSVT